MPRVFSPRGNDKLAEILTHFPDKRSALLSTLRLAEEEFGSIDNDALECVASCLDLSPAHVYGVFTFYTLFRKPEHGKYVLDVCCTLPCALRGARELTKHLVDRLGVQPGGSTADGVFTLRKVECLAACERAPVVQVNFDDIKDNLTPEKLDQIIETLRREARDNP